MPAEYDPTVDYYAILCVEATATTADIKKAHRARINELHPDRGGDAAKSSVVNVARDVLSKPNLRREYDQARRDWILRSLQSPLMQAFLDPDGRLAASLAAQTNPYGSIGDVQGDVAATASNAHPSPAQPAASQSATLESTPEADRWQTVVGALGAHWIEPPGKRFLWVAANELPLLDELVPFLLARSGQPLDGFGRWVAPAVRASGC